jgi:hypothetical protein
LNDFDFSDDQCYNYIDIVKDENVCYKYVKTLRKDVVDEWFTDPPNAISHSETFSIIPVEDDQEIKVYD